MTKEQQAAALEACDSRVPGSYTSVAYYRDTLRLALEALRVAEDEIVRLRGIIAELGHTGGCTSHVMVQPDLHFDECNCPKGKGGE